MPSIEEVLEERGKRYGEFNGHARITQGIKSLMISGRSWTACSPSQREALDMIAHKIGRIVNGDPYYLDSWVDISGYNELVVKELQAVKQPVPEAYTDWNLHGHTLSTYSTLNECEGKPYALYSRDGYAWYMSLADKQMFCDYKMLPDGLIAAHRAAIAKKGQTR